MPYQQQFSYGRGGAGNMRNTRPSTTSTEDELRMPAIKSSVFTTGRGGSGNMVTNDQKNPQFARMSQDLEAPLPVQKGRESGVKIHLGRGGAANVYLGPPPEEYLEDGMVVSSEPEHQPRSSLHRILSSARRRSNDQRQSTDRRPSTDQRESSDQPSTIDQRRSNERRSSERRRWRWSEMVIIAHY